jgi:hypothetical protein
LTLTRNLVLMAWHSGGLQAIDTSDPGAPAQGRLVLADAARGRRERGPGALGRPEQGRVWSFPIVKDGLVYVIDIRNGLYVLRYTGPHADEVAVVSSSPT